QRRGQDQGRHGRPRSLRRARRRQSTPGREGVTSAARLRRAAIGLRPHSGWAALVVLAGDGGSPEVVDRRRIEIADPTIAGSRQPYHAAEALRLDRAEHLLARLAEAARRRSVEGL